MYLRLMCSPSRHNAIIPHQRDNINRPAGPRLRLSRAHPLQVWSTRASGMVLLRPLRRARVGADLRIFPAITRDLIESREKSALLMRLPGSILRPVRKILKDFPAQIRYYQSIRENRILRIDRPSYGGTGVSYCGGIPRAFRGYVAHPLGVPSRKGYGGYRS